MLRPAIPGIKPASGLASALASALVVMAGAGTAALSPAALAQAEAPAPAIASPAEGLSVEAARAAANRILQAEQRRDAQARFSQFAPELQAVTSPAMIAETMARRPAIRGWKLLSVQSGLRGSTVEVELNTVRGSQHLFMVLNTKGQISGYYFDRGDQAPSQVAGQFVRALSAGHYITARGFLSPELQREMSAAQLQARWQELQRETGNFVRVNRVVVGPANQDQRLVLVNTTFNRLTDNLFVLMDANNIIFNVDFPNEPEKLRGVN
jgi:hypothetical protein